MELQFHKRETGTQFHDEWVAGEANAVSFVVVKKWNLRSSNDLTSVTRIHSFDAVASKNHRR